MTETTSLTAACAGAAGRARLRDGSFHMTKLLKCLSKEVTLSSVRAWRLRLAGPNELGNN
jgi:hypothetical protein